MLWAQEGDGIINDVVEASDLFFMETDLERSVRGELVRKRRAGVVRGSVVGQER